MTIREGSRMNGTSARIASFGAASLLAATLLAAPAFADGLPSKGKTKAPHEVETRPCSVTANVGYTSDYVFRGLSQTNEDPALQGGVELACGNFYLGSWGSSVAFTGGAPEIDVYGGYKTTINRVALDFGFIYYSYPGASSSLDLDFFELKAAAGTEVWKGGTIASTVFYSPDYTALFANVGRLGPVTTLEGTFSQALPQVSIFSPTFSATVGHSFFSDEIGNFDPSYTYWNVGVTLGFREKWSLDLRYWDTDGEGAAEVFGDFAEGRFVATVKYTF
jgi:uncharacterized protein (TIGR02001 family)